MSGNTPVPAPATGSNPVLEGIEARIRAIQDEATQRGAAIQNAPDRLALQRDWIAKAIIGVFVGAVAIGLAILVLEGLRDPSSWKDVATQSADLIKSTVLPVVTLVLGYYFGQASKN